MPLRSPLGAVIVTDDGTVLEPPSPPPKEAPIDDWIAHMRAVDEFSDRVADIANRAFERAFLKEIHKS